MWKRLIEFGKFNLTTAKKLIYEMKHLIRYKNHEKKNNRCKYFQEIINNYLTNAKT